jgi:uncharacterized protein (TIGR00297 family)
MGNPVHNILHTQRGREDANGSHNRIFTREKARAFLHTLRSEGLLLNQYLYWIEWTEMLINGLISLYQLALGVLLALAIAFAAYRLHSLSRSGAIAAALLGTVVFGLGGLAWAVLLVAFFVTSSALSKIFTRKKAKLDEKFSKGSERDAGQVAANGAVAGTFVLLHLVFPQAAWPWLGFAGTLAAVNADTWATELGVLNPSPPRMITTGKIAENGTSGAISLTGTLAALGGALLIALLGAWIWPAGIPAYSFAVRVGSILVISLAGLGGSLVDSMLGATVQAIYTCPTCCKETERHPLHHCGTPTTLKRGWGWLNNDWVNTACAVSGAILALLLSLGLPL